MYENKTLNEKVIKLLKEHPEGGEKFFNALDLLVRSDRGILDDFIAWSIKYIKDYYRLVENINTNESIGIVLTGKFGNAVISNYAAGLHKEFADVLVVNGDIRVGAIPEIYRDSFEIKKYVLLDDSFYSGTTMLGIEKAMQEIDSAVHIAHACVIYDGSKEPNDNVSSLYKYY